MRRTIKLEVMPWKDSVVDEVYWDDDSTACFRAPKLQYCYYTHEIHSLSRYQGSLQRLFTLVVTRRFCEVVSETTPPVKIGQYRALSQMYVPTVGWSDNNYATQVFWSGWVVATEANYYMLLTQVGMVFVMQTPYKETLPFAAFSGMRPDYPLRRLADPLDVNDHTYEELLLCSCERIRNWARDHFAE